MPKKCMVAGCIVYSGKKVLLIHHRKLGKWLYPGGHMESGEFPYETAAREVKEETGLDVTIFSRSSGRPFRSAGASERPLPFATVEERVPYKDGAHTHFDTIYLARRSRARAKGGINSSEANGMGWFSRHEIEKIDTYPNVRTLLLRFFSAHS